MRCALKFGYFGRSFLGYARQPELRTIEGEIINALKKTKIISDEKNARLQTASRTDKGVSAIGNVLAINTDFRRSEILGAINAHLKDICFYGLAEVENTFNPRHAKERWYRYYLIDEGKSLKSVKEAASIFVGTHDFSNFARVEGNDPFRTIDSIEISKEKDFIILDFKAESYLWHMVRRMVKAITDAGNGILSYDDIKDALAGKQEKDFGIAPPEPLILMDVQYDFEFDIDKANLEKMKAKLKKELNGLRLEGIIYELILGIEKRNE